MLTLNLLNFLLDFFVNTVPNLDLVPHEVPPPMQYEHGDAMGKNEWLHEGLRGCCKVNACISSYAGKWLFHKHLDQTHGLYMQLGRSRHSSICFRGLRQQDHISINVSILNNPHARQKWNEKKTFYRVEKKEKFKWDELQT
jgi:hypothetical protein